MPIQMPRVEYDVVELKGGLDQITSTLSLKPGVLRDAINYECAPTGGYSRIGGYERYSGLTRPSDATYSVVQVTSFTNTPSLGQTLTGQTSAATGTIIALGSNYIVLTQVSGTFTASEVVAVGVTTIGTATTLTATWSDKLGAQYRAAAADVYRALISAVPGSGPVRGLAGLTVSGTDHIYALRDNVGGTAVNLYVDSGSGWTQINFKYEVSFTTGGASTPSDGATLTQGGVTATVRRVMDSSGTWSGSTAAGRLVIDAPSGGNFAAGVATLTGGISVTLTGAQTAITLSPGGKFFFSTGNLAGSSSTIRLYGCDGVNRGFEFDGTTLAPIATGATSDTPKYVAIHQRQLMWALGSSVIHSGPGKPYRYSSTDGGSEIAVGDTVTGFLIQPGAQTTGALAIYTRATTSVLYGTGTSDWNLVNLPQAGGALDYSGQNLNQSYVFGNDGVSSMATTQAFGNFASATITNSLRTFIENERSKIAYSCIHRGKSQYRIFFNDGYGLYATIVNGKMLGAVPTFFPDIPYCAWEWQPVGGDEALYFGGTDGYVYQLDKGSSFDGDSLDAYITLNWNSIKSPRSLKRYRHASVEMQGNYFAEITFGYQLGYGTTALGQPAAVAYESGFQSPQNWDSFTWDSFTWDGRTLFPTEVDLQGTAENIQYTLSSSGNYIYPFTINSIITHYTPRRGLR